MPELDSRAKRPPPLPEMRSLIKGYFQDSKRKEAVKLASASVAKKLNLNKPPEGISRMKSSYACVSNGHRQLLRQQKLMKNRGKMEEETEAFSLQQLTIDLHSSDAMSTISRQSSVDNRSAPSSDDILHKQFGKVTQIGSGCYSTVFVGKHHLDKVSYAIKIIDGKHKLEKSIRQSEAQIMSMLNFRDAVGVVKYQTSWMDDATGTIHIQMEYCERGSVAHINEFHRGKWTEAQLLKLIAHVSVGLRDIHDAGVIHNDIKPENIFCKLSGAYKIGDFGLSRFLPKDLSAFESCLAIEEGDGKYLSKERLNETLYLKEADIFALGISIYELASGKPLPKGGAEWNMLREGNIPFQGLPYSNEFASLVRQLMHCDPTKRPTAEEVMFHSLVIPFSTLKKRDMQAGAGTVPVYETEAENIMWLENWVSSSNDAKRVRTAGHRLSFDSPLPSPRTPTTAFPFAHKPGFAVPETPKKPTAQAMKIDIPEYDHSTVLGDMLDLR